MLKKLIFTHTVFMDPENCFKVELSMDGNYRITCSIGPSMYYGTLEKEPYLVKPEDCKKIIELVDECGLWTWNQDYKPEGYEVLDGFSWDLVYEDTSEIIGSNKNVIEVGGSNAYPWCFYKLIKAILIAAPELKDKLECYIEEKEPVYGF